MCEIGEKLPRIVIIQSLQSPRKHSSQAMFPIFVDRLGKFGAGTAESVLRVGVRRYEVPDCKQSRVNGQIRRAFRGPGGTCPQDLCTFR